MMPTKVSPNGEREREKKVNVVVVVVVVVVVARTSVWWPGLSRQLEEVV